MELVELEITEYSKKGRGVSKDTEVAGTIVGEAVLAASFRRQKAELLKILKPSIHRVEPKCPYAGTCGGCSWQHIDYKEQLRMKQKIVEDLFEGYPIEPICGMQDPWHYRSKMEYTFSESKTKEKFLGLNQINGRGRVVDLEACYIAPSWMGEVLNRVRAWWRETTLEAFFPPANRGSLRTLTMRSSFDQKSKMVILTVSGNAEYALSRTELEGFVNAAFIDEEVSVFLLIQSAVKGEVTKFYEMHLKGPDALKEAIHGKEVRLSPQAFYQPNGEVSKEMFKKAIEMLDLRGEEKVLDLFCGIGTIGMHIAPYVKEVIGVEISKEAVCDGKDNIQRLQIPNMKLYAEDAAVFLSRNIQYKPDIVVVDPPRSGLGPKAIALLNEMQTKKILYISCNPRTQKEDVDQIQGYSIRQIAPFDQFPHTPHIENIILLTR